MGKSFIRSRAYVCCSISKSSRGIIASRSARFAMNSPGGWPTASGGELIGTPYPQGYHTAARLMSQAYFRQSNRSVLCSVQKISWTLLLHLSCGADDRFLSSAWPQAGRPQKTMACPTVQLILDTTL